MNLTASDYEKGIEISERGFSNDFIKSSTGDVNRAAFN
jgi:hypothetical protein